MTEFWAHELQVEEFPELTNRGKTRVRITHLPTGKVVECGRYQSLMKNKAAAMDRLCGALGVKSPAQIIE